MLKSIDHGHSGLREFLDSRLIKSKEFQSDSWTKNRPQYNKGHQLNDDQTVIVASVLPQTDRKAAAISLFQHTKTGERSARRNKEISTRVFDIPGLHLASNPESYKLINLLAKSTDNELFKSTPIQVIINERWK